MLCKYEAREDTLRDEDGVIHNVYGLNVREGKEIVGKVPDIFLERRKAVALAEFSSALELNLSQIYDIIEIIL